MTGNISKNWLLTIKVVLMAVSFLFIYYHVTSEEVITRFYQGKTLFLESKSTRNYIYIVLLLMCLNWLLEALKWKLLTASFYPQSLLQAWRAVMTGVAISFFTPNRSGDFAGRILHLPAEHRLNGAVHSVAGSLAQLLITITAGGVSLLLMMQQLSGITLNPGVIYIMIPAVVILLHVFFVSIPALGDKLAGTRFRTKWLLKLTRIRHISKNLLAGIYLLSVIRYAVFTFQFYILLIAFEPSFEQLFILPLIMATFLLITLIPSFALSEIGVRGSVGVFLFSAFNYDVTYVLVAVTLLWFINIVIPALSGAISMLYLKFDS